MTWGAGEGAGHRLAEMLAGVAAGTPPPSDGQVEVLPSLGPTLDDVVLATDGHLMITTDLPAKEVHARFRPSAYTDWCHPAALLWLCSQTGRTPGTSDVLFVGSSLDGPPAIELTASAGDHPRLAEGRLRRHDPHQWTTQDRSGMCSVARGLVGRWELAYEVEPGARRQGMGAGLARAARHLLPGGELLWAQTVPGNVASVRALLAAGFVPVGGETLLLAPPVAARDSARFRTHASWFRSRFGDAGAPRRGDGEAAPVLDGQLLGPSLGSDASEGEGLG